MPVAPEHLGPWVQIAHVLRFTKDQPPRTDRESARPRKGSKGNWGEFLDLDAPTLVSFEPDDAVDVPALLRAGAIQPVPVKHDPIDVKKRLDAVRKAMKEAPSGEASGA
jgi:hypothetical protein